MSQTQTNSNSHQLLAKMESHYLATRATNTLSTAVFSPNANVSDDQLSDFVEQLVKLVAGVSLEEIKPDKQAEVVQEVIDIYLNFLTEFVEETQGKRKALQYKIFSSDPTPDLLARFQGLKDHLQEAHQVFINTMITQ